MLERGFYDDMITILQNEDMSVIGKRQTLLFSATYPAEIQKSGQKFLHNYLFLAVGHNIKIVEFSHHSGRISRQEITVRYTV